MPHVGRAIRSAAISAVGLVAIIASTASSYEITWSTLDTGGATFSTGGSYSLGGTVGQPDAGACAGGAYTLVGGFWGLGGPSPTDVPLPDLNGPSGYDLPTAFRLSPCAPNPFVGSTTIAFDLPAPSAVDLRIYNVAGRLVRTLAVGPRPAGHHRVEWSGLDDDTRRVSNGIYFVRLQAGSSRATQKIVLTH